MVIPSTPNGNSTNIAAAAATIPGTKRKSKVPVSTSFSGLSKPRKPRGPRTPYNFFFADERAKMGEAESQQDAAATMAAIKQGGTDATLAIATTKPKPTFETTKARNKEIAKKWRHFAQMQKLLGDNDLMKSYRAMAAEDEIRYKTEMAEYLDDVEAYNEAEAEAEQEFIQLKKRVIADAHAKHGKKKKAKVEENDSSTTTTNTSKNDEARVQPSFSGSPTNAGTSSNTKDQDPITRGVDEGEAAAAATMTTMASGLGLHRTPLQNRIHPGPPRAAVHPGAPAPPAATAAAVASPYYMHGAQFPHPPPPPPQYHNPNMPYYYPGGMYTMPHMAHPPTLNAMMAQRAGEAAAVHMPPSMPAQAVDERVSATMAYLQGYAAACSAMVDRQVSAAPTAPTTRSTPAQGQKDPPASAPTRSDLEKAVAVAGPVPTAKVAAPSTTEDDAALLEESPLTQKKVDEDIFVARRRQGQKTTEE